MIEPNIYEGSNVIPIAPKQRTIRIINKDLDEMKAEIQAAAKLLQQMYNAINMFKKEFNDFRDKVEAKESNE